MVVYWDGECFIGHMNGIASSLLVFFFFFTQASGAAGGGEGEEDIEYEELSLRQFSVGDRINAMMVLVAGYRALEVPIMKSCYINVGTSPTEGRGSGWNITTE
ncbi:hypothetical protein F4810DRAFT_656266 [Camillea tinctor]|nr:hypothetical protein F4810DRAFT_656266 [Camillea tinctor]